MKQAIATGNIGGDGEFSMRCKHWIEDRFGAQAAYLTTSGTSALEMAHGSATSSPEMRSSFPASPSRPPRRLLQRGARLVFVDVRPDTMNIDETKIEAAITPDQGHRPVTTGISCEMDHHGDRPRARPQGGGDAQGVMATYKGARWDHRRLWLLLVPRDEELLHGRGRAIVIRDPRSTTVRRSCARRAPIARATSGQVDKYTWVDYGSSLLPSDMLAAYLWAQLQEADRINDDRRATWDAYYQAFLPLSERGLLGVPTVPEECVHNAHLFYVKLADLAERTAFMGFLKEHGVQSSFHYVPLHSAPAGLRYGRFSGEDVYTTRESDRLTRLPMYYGMVPADRDKVIETVLSFFEGR